MGGDWTALWSLQLYLSQGAICTLENSCEIQQNQVVFIWGLCWKSQDEHLVGPAEGVATSKRVSRRM